MPITALFIPIIFPRIYFFRKKISKFKGHRKLVPFPWYHQFPQRREMCAKRLSLWYRVNEVYIKGHLSLRSKALQSLLSLGVKYMVGTSRE